MARSPGEAEALAASLLPIHSANDVARLPSDVDGVFAIGLSDALLGVLADNRPTVRHIFADGNSRALTDRGLQALPKFTALESLDLEWSAVTDAGLHHIAAVQSLRWVDLGGCAGVTRQGVAALRTRRPDLEIEPGAA